MQQPPANLDAFSKPAADAGSAGETRGYLLENWLHFVAALRQAGLRVSTQQNLDLLSALSWVEIGQPRQFFYVARATLVSRRDDLQLFELLFRRFFRSPDDPAAPPKPRPAPTAPRHDPNPEKRFDIVTYMAFKARQGDQEIEVAERSGSYSSHEVLQSKDFSDMSAEELDRVRRLMQQLRWRVSQRTTRRRIPYRRGPFLDQRRTLQQALRCGSLPAQLPRLRRKIKQRPIVLLADISGSMEKYSRLVLLFFYSLCQTLGQVEAFAFATRLTYLTPQLRLRNVDRALDDAAREVVDWSGGTRIGDCLQTFHQRWSRRVLRRGALVIVVSDGWERGDSDHLAKQMRYLNHRCHRLIWLNPLAGRERYQPLVEGMAAALPWIDDFRPIHNLQSLEQLVKHLANLPAAGPTGSMAGYHVVKTTSRGAPSPPSRGEAQ